MDAYSSRGGGELGLLCEFGVLNYRARILGSHLRDGVVAIEEEPALLGGDGADDAGVFGEACLRLASEKPVAHEALRLQTAEF